MLVYHGFGIAEMYTETQIINMLIFRFTTSWLLLTTLAGSVAPPVYAQNVYDQILLQVKQQQPQTELEDAVKDFAVLQAQKKDPSITEQTVLQQINDQVNAVCEDAVCTAMQDVKQNTLLPVDFRMLSRTLNTIARSYENGIVGITGTENGLASKWPSISAIWESGYDTSTATTAFTKVRTIAMPTNIEDKLKAITGILQGLTPDERAAAVWQYRHGSQAQITSGSCSAGPTDTPTLWQTMRFCALETAMQEALTAIKAIPIIPPAQPGELLSLRSIQITELDIFIWSRFDDVGLSWILGADTIHTAFTYKSSALVLADYDYGDPPKEPDVNEGICSHPTGKRGYLCRQVSNEQCPVPADGCAIDPATGTCYDPKNTTATGAVLTITTCEKQDFRDMVTYSESGPNVCKIGGWLEDATGDELVTFSKPYVDRDPAINADIKEELNECSNCVIDLYCADTCGSSGSQGGFTFKKTNDGVIKVCMPNAGVTQDGLSSYLLLYEIVHAQQMCNLPPNADVFATRSQCCARERDAYLILCNALWADGILQETGMDIDTCASQLSNMSCEGYKTSTEAACTNSPDRSTELLTKLRTVARDNKVKFKLKTSCPDIIKNLDARATSAIATTTQVCNPNCAVEYKNTIGNNLCYIGQCIEQSVEEHRLTPGRWTNGVQDGAFPWDACMQSDPEHAVVVPVTPDKTMRLPAYEPQRIMELMDAQLCEQNGYPRLTPPVLCGFNAGASLQGSQTLESVQRLESRLQEDTANASVSALSRELTGGRIGTSVFVHYLQNTVPYLNEILQTVRDLLTQIGDTQFPLTMCPRDAPADCSIFVPPVPPVTP